MKPSSIWDGKKLQGSVVFIAKVFVFPATITVFDETFDVIYYSWPVIITTEDLVRLRFTWVSCSWVVVKFFDEAEPKLANVGYEQFIFEKYPSIGDARF